MKEREVLTPTDEEYHQNKKVYTVPFVCGCCDLEKQLAVVVKVHPCFVQKESRGRVCRKVVGKKFLIFVEGFFQIRDNDLYIIIDFNICCKSFLDVESALIYLKI
ncbi:hypothetical protein JOC76_000558 [Neobacillus cucumis]|nr:hypothetical protein [Neobacillus cucumis]